MFSYTRTSLSAYSETTERTKYIMRQRKSWGLKDKLFLKLLRRELLIFLIPVTLLFMLAAIGINRQFQYEEDQLIQKLEDDVGIVQASLDEYIQRCQTIKYVLMQDDAVYYLRNTHQFSSADHTVKVHQVANLLHTQCLTNDFLHDIIICMTENKINVNTQGYMTPEQVYQQYIAREDKNYTYVQWTNDSNELQNGKLLVLPNKTCYFVTTYPITPRAAVNKCITLMKFKDGIFSTYLSDASGQRSYTVIDTANKTDLFHVLEPLNINTDQFVFNKTNGSFIQDGYYIAYQKSEKLDVVYLTAVSQDGLRSQKNSQMLWVTLLLITGLILGGGFIIVYSMNKLNPINQLRSTVHTDGNHPSLFLDPYAETKSILLETADEQITWLNESRHPNLEKLQHNFIALLYDKKENLDLLSEASDQLNIPYQDKLICIIKLKCIDISNYFQKKGRQNNSDCSPIQFCSTLISEMISEKYQLQSIPYGNEAYFIFSAENQTLELSMKEIRHEMQQIQRLLQESYEVDTLIAFSNFHSGIKGLRSAFKEANYIMDYMEFSSSSNFAEYGVVSVINKHRGISDEFIKDETRMLNAIKAEEFDRARELFDQILLFLFPNMQDKSQTAKFHIYALAGKMLEAFDTVNRIHSDNWLAELDVNGHLLNFETLREFRENMYKLFDNMKNTSRKVEDENKNSLASTIIDIISSNYMNPDLNVSMIAGLLDKNLDYVSRTFKKSTGLGVLECIQDYRIGKAKGYLEENPGLTIQQVSSMVGYVNCESFIRIFKQKQGVTPGRYKTTLKNK